MKNLVLGLVAVSVAACNTKVDSSSLVKDDATAEALPVVACSSEEKIDGWIGHNTFENLRFTAYVVSSTELRTAIVKGAYESDSANIAAESNYVPRNPAYASMNRFSALEDAWNWFKPLLPKNLGDLARGSEFTGYIQIMGEEGYKGTHKLQCRIVGNQGQTSGDAQLMQDVAAAIAGLETGGGEGDPFPYAVVELDLAAGEELTNQVLLKRLLPKFEGMEHEGVDMIAGLEEYNAAANWASLTATPIRSDYDSDADYLSALDASQKWTRVKAIFDQKLTGVRSLVMGYRSFEGGSLETGPVAHVIVGRTASGKVIAIYGIDIWT
jgi:hypothetical protein